MKETAGLHSRFHAKLHDINQRLDQKVHQQPQIVQQYRESEVKQTNREVRRGRPRCELLDFAVGGFDAISTAVAVDLFVRPASVETNLVVDVRGTVFVFSGDGTTVWARQLGSYTWGQPAVNDLHGDGEPETAVGAGGSGHLYLFEQDGRWAWETPVSFESPISWMATGQTDGDYADEIVVATARGWPRCDG